MHLVADSQGRHNVAKLYRQGYAPSATVMERLPHVARDHVVQVIRSGLSEDRHYELQEFIAGGTLRDLMRGPMSESEVRGILAELSEAVASLHQAGIVHRDLKPENVLVRSRTPLDLVLADFGISSVVNEQLGGVTLRACTPEYAAPEINTVPSPANDYWSLGMLVAESLLGIHPHDAMGVDSEYAGMDGTAIDLSEISTETWRNLCAGLLEVSHTHRWGITEVRAWLKDPSRVPVTRVKPAVSPTGFDSLAMIEPLEVAGIRCRSPRGLAAALARNWQTGVSMLTAGSIQIWLRDHLKHAALADFAISLAVDTSTSPDVRLQRLIYRLEPTLPPYWKGEEIRLAHLGSLANDLISGANPQAGARFLDLFDNRALGNYPIDTYRDIDARWSASYETYAGNRNLAEAVGSPVDALPPRDIILAHLFNSAAFPAYTENIRHELQELIDERILSCRWFARLGNPTTADFPMLLLMRLLAERAIAVDRWENVQGTVTRGDTRRQVTFFAHCRDWFYGVDGTCETIARFTTLHWAVPGAHAVYLRRADSYSPGQPLIARLSRRVAPTDEWRVPLVAESTTFHLYVIWSGKHFTESVIRLEVPRHVLTPMPSIDSFHAVPESTPMAMEIEPTVGPVPRPVELIFDHPAPDWERRLVHVQAPNSPEWASMIAPPPSPCPWPKATASLFIQ
ncbi:MAG: serine/threonine-protein kinase [Hydrogenophilales bacterium]|nr:serine/threonine-protein kinase [Hydrogenophilales bacterium]